MVQSVMESCRRIEAKFLLAYQWTVGSALQNIRSIAKKAKAGSPVVAQYDIYDSNPQKMTVMTMEEDLCSILEKALLFARRTSLNE